MVPFHLLITSPSTPDLEPIEKKPTFAPSLQYHIPVSLRAPVYMKWFTDLKQSAPWWLMLVLQIIQAILEALS